MSDMNKDQVKGSMEKAKGSVKETVGKAVGSEKMKVEGAAEKAAGTVRKAAGDAKETAKDARSASFVPYRTVQCGRLGRRVPACAHPVEGAPFGLRPRPGICLRGALNERQHERRQGPL